MKKLFTLIFLATLMLSACTNTNTAETTSGDSYTSSNLPVDYEGALPVRNQLALGTLLLIEADQAPTTKQAQELIVLWQALRSTQNTSGVAQEEISALLGQIEGLLTQDQLAAIRDMQLTNADMQTWAAENGIAMGAGGGQGAGKNLSPEARATRQAEEGRTPSSSSSSGGSSAIIDALIAKLQTLIP